MDEPTIPQDDQERINAMVASYRHSIENLYRVAYLQGQIDQSVDDLRKLRAEARA